jgi:hypothetical protein
MSNVPAEAEEGLTSSRRVRDAEPHNVRTWARVCDFSGKGHGSVPGRARLTWHSTPLRPPARRAKRACHEKTMYARLTLWSERYETLPPPPTCYVAAYAILPTGRSLLTGSMEDSFVRTISAMPMRSYSAQTLPSQ